MSKEAITNGTVHAGSSSAAKNTPSGCWVVFYKDVFAGETASYVGPIENRDLTNDYWDDLDKGDNEEGDYTSLELGPCSKLTVYQDAGLSTSDSYHVFYGADYPDGKINLREFIISGSNSWSDSISSWKLEYVAPTAVPQNPVKSNPLGCWAIFYTGVYTGDTYAYMGPIDKDLTGNEKNAYASVELGPGAVLTVYQDGNYSENDSYRTFKASDYAGGKINFTTIGIKSNSDSNKWDGSISSWKLGYLAPNSDDIVYATTEGSNLKSVNYDVVVGITQNSLNNTIKDYLLNLQAPIRYAIYKFTDTTYTTTRLLSESETIAFMQIVNPFAANAQSNKALLKSNLFAYGFAGQSGVSVPDGPPTVRQDAIDALPNSLKLVTADPNSVEYTLYFKSLKVVEMQMKEDKLVITEQTAGQPWLFTYLVSLQLVQKQLSYNSLTAAQQSSLNASATNSMFSVSQLCLNLQTPAYQNSAVTISSETPISSKALNALNLFTNVYWTDLKENGDVIFSASVTPLSTTARPASTIVPGALSFIIKPYYTDANLTVCDELSTLNYLILAQPKTVANFDNPLKNMTWNWMNAQDDTDFDGVVSVRGAIYADLLRPQLNAALQCICQQPYASMNYDSEFGKDEVTYSVTFGPAYAPQPAYSAGSEQVNWESVKSTDDDGRDGSMSVQTFVSSSVHFDDTKIIIDTVTRMYLELVPSKIFGVDAAHIDGNVYASHDIYTATMTVGAEGNINVVVTPTSEDLLGIGYSTGQLEDPSFWDNYCTYSNLDTAVADLKDTLAGQMADARTAFTAAITASLNENAAFVFPGNQTFMYKDCRFAPSKDLVAAVTYLATH